MLIEVLSPSSAEGVSDAKAIDIVSWALSFKHRHVVCATLLRDTSRETLDPFTGFQNVLVQLCQKPTARTPDLCAPKAVIAGLTWTTTSNSRRYLPSCATRTQRAPVANHLDKMEPSEEVGIENRLLCSSKDAEANATCNV